MPACNPPPPFEHPELELSEADGRLWIRERNGEKGPGMSLCVDFLSKSSLLRVTEIGRRSHPLARAVGRQQPLPRILDGTAGLGRDAFVLACLGYEVTAVERHPVLHALLADGLARLLAHPRGPTLVGDRLTARLGSSENLLSATPPDVVFLDPMFPTRRKSALVKKEMQLLQRLLVDEDSGADLLAAARSVAKSRVVVKRPTQAEPLADDVSYTVPGSKVRFDVYLSESAT